jgi:competence protein ComFB
MEQGEFIKNYMEDCVIDLVEDIMKGMDVCACEKCRMDVAAIALNSLPPKYVVTRKGQLYTKLSVLQQQFNVDTVSAITKATVIVSERPRHD